MSNRPKNTIYVGGIPSTCDESVVLSYFEPFGEIMQIQLPKVGARQQQQQPQSTSAPSGHRGFGFVMYSTDGEAESAIDNMHLNELHGHIITVSLAKPIKQGGTNDSRKPIWESEDWIKEYGGGEDEQNQGPSVEAGAA